MLGHCRAARAVALVGALGVGAACSALSGLGDLQEVDFDGSVVEASALDVGSPDQSTGDVVAPTDVGNDFRSDGDAALVDHGDAGCSPDVSTDPLNCGRCGHSCLGGACMASACQPFPLAAGPAGAMGIAVDALNVYWTVWADAGVVMQAPITNGSALTLSGNLVQPLGIVTTATDVYFTQYPLGFALSKVPIDGGATAVVNPGGADGKRHLTRNGTSFFWANETNGDIVQLPFGASSYTILEGGQLAPAGIAADDVSIYWVNSGDGTIATTPFPNDGGAPTILATGSANPRFLTIDATTVYWTAETGGDVSSIPKSGGQSTTLASGQALPDGIAVDSGNVFWVNRGDGTVMRTGLGGGGASTLATGQAGPSGLVVDATSLYWTNTGDGTVMRLAK